jgi:hypothetical protein
MRDNGERLERLAREYWELFEAWNEAWNLYVVLEPGDEGFSPALRAMVEARRKCWAKNYELLARCSWNAALFVKLKRLARPRVYIPRRKYIPREKRPEPEAAAVE